MTSHPDTARPATADAIARTICWETCAFYGEPPCFTMTETDGPDMGKPLPWPNPHCDEPGCQALATAVLARLQHPQPHSEGCRMSETKWTPGPWTWSIEDYSMACLIRPYASEDEPEHFVLSVHPCTNCQRMAHPKLWEWGRCRTPKLADACLIAAAPELYEALDVLVTELIEAGITGRDADAVREARAALAKARGEDSAS